MSESYQITAVGDGFVGKTCMLIRYTKNAEPTGYEPTVFDNYAGTITVDDKVYDIQLWDTAGQEEYDRLRPLSYKTTSCFLVCFSLDSQSSYENVEQKWVPEVRHFKPKTPIVLVGTKLDLRYDGRAHCLTKEEGLRLKELVRANAYVECSAVSTEGIQEVFETAIKTILIKQVTKKRICCIL